MQASSSRVAKALKIKVKVNNIQQLAVNDQIIGRLNDFVTKSFILCSSGSGQNSITVELYTATE